MSVIDVVITCLMVQQKVDKKLRKLSEAAPAAAVRAAKADEDEEDDGDDDDDDDDDIAQGGPHAAGFADLEAQVIRNAA